MKTNLSSGNFVLEKCMCVQTKLSTSQEISNLSYLWYNPIPTHLPPDERPGGTHCLCMCEIFSVKSFVHLPCSYVEDYTNQECFLTPAEI